MTENGKGLSQEKKKWDPEELKDLLTNRRCEICGSVRYSTVSLIGDRIADLCNDCRNKWALFALGNNVHGEVLHADSWMHIIRHIQIGEDNAKRVVEGYKEVLVRMHLIAETWISDQKRVTAQLKEIKHDGR